LKDEAGECQLINRQVKDCTINSSEDVPPDRSENYGPHSRCFIWENEWTRKFGGAQVSKCHSSMVTTQH